LYPSPPSPPLPTTIFCCPEKVSPAAYTNPPAPPPLEIIPPPPPPPATIRRLPVTLAEAGVHAYVVSVLFVEGVPNVPQVYVPLDEFEYTYPAVVAADTVEYAPE
jgi:hypothetical protein